MESSLKVVTQSPSHLSYGNAIMYILALGWRGAILLAANRCRKFFQVHRLSCLVMCDGKTVRKELLYLVDFPALAPANGPLSNQLLQISEYGEGHCKLSPHPPFVFQLLLGPFYPNPTLTTNGLPMKITPS